MIRVSSWSTPSLNERVPSLNRCPHQHWSPPRWLDGHVCRDRLSETRSRFFDVGFSAVGELKCLDQLWWSYGQTRTAPSLFHSVRLPVMTCPPSTQVLRVLPPSRHPRAMYETNPFMSMALDLIDSPGDRFSAKIRIHHAG